jgi:phosphoglycerate dehydrogenase-like enzyme
MGLVVMITGPVSDDQITRLGAELPDVTFRYFPLADDLEAVVEQADVIAGEISPDAFARATNLKWQHTWGAGADRSLSPEMMASPVVLTCSKGNGAIPLAEHALMLMLMLGGGATLWLDAQRAHRWDPHRHLELHGQTCGIVGLGHSGVHLAGAVKALGMVTLGLRRTEQPARFIDEMYTRDRLGEFLGRSDFVVVTAPITDETRGMFGEREFEAMKPSAYFICFSRGGIADDSALLRALEERQIAGAGLDAHSVEPLPADSPFWTAPNTIITPHNGASSPKSRERAFEYFATNLRHYLAGEPFINVVDKAAGY